MKVDQGARHVLLITMIKAVTMAFRLEKVDRATEYVFGHGSSLKEKQKKVLTAFARCSDASHARRSGTQSLFAIVSSSSGA